MKIRIKGDSLRYRLTKTDIKKVEEEGYLEESTNFGPQKLVYALEVRPVESMLATFNDGKITLYITDAMAKEWVNTDRVGFESNNNGLALLVEKDFTCLENVAEDQSDNYPNPLAHF